MGVRIEKKWVAYFSYDGHPVIPGELAISEKDIREYMEENPMPEDPAYSPEDLIYDLTRMSEGAYFLPRDIKPETAEYIEELLNSLI